MDNIKIDRINTLAHKAKSVGLTEAEKKEQAALRKEYLATIRMNLRTQLDNISIKEKDGTITNLGEKYGFTVEYDASGTIGKRYARADEIGIPLAITVDFEGNITKKGRG